MLMLLVNWLVLSIAVLVTAELLPGIRVKSFKSALLVAIVFGLLNFVLGKILFFLFAVLTLGVAWLLAFITHWLVDAIVLKLTSKVTDHIYIDGFGSALLGALCISLLSAFGHWLILAI